MFLPLPVVMSIAISFLATKSFPVAPGKDQSWVDRVGRPALTFRNSTWYLAESSLQCERLLEVWPTAEDRSDDPATEFDRARQRFEEDPSLDSERRWFLALQRASDARCVPQFQHLLQRAEQSVKENPEDLLLRLRAADLWNTRYLANGGSRAFENGLEHYRAARRIAPEQPWVLCEEAQHWITRQHREGLERGSPTFLLTALALVDRARSMRPDSFALVARAVFVRTFALMLEMRQFPGQAPLVDPVFVLPEHLDVPPDDPSRLKLEMYALLQQFSVREIFRRPSTGATDPALAHDELDRILERLRRLAKVETPPKELVDCVTALLGCGVDLEHYERRLTTLVELGANPTTARAVSIPLLVDRDSPLAAELAAKVREGASTDLERRILAAYHGMFGDLESAVHWLDALETRTARTELFRAGLQLALGHSDAAATLAQSFEEADLDPDLVSYRAHLLGVCAALEGRRDEARTLLAHAIETATADPAAIRVTLTELGN